MNLRGNKVIRKINESDKRDKYGHIVYKYVPHCNNMGIFWRRVKQRLVCLWCHLWDEQSVKRNEFSDSPPPNAASYPANSRHARNDAAYGASCSSLQSINQHFRLEVNTMWRLSCFSDWKLLQRLTYKDIYVLLLGIAKFLLWFTDSLSIKDICP